MYSLPKIIKIRAFTLVELLFSMALVMILMLVVTQIMRSTQMVTSASRKHLDADDEARTVFDRMEADFSKMVKRTDVDFLFQKTNGNDSFYFFSEAPSQAPAITNGSTNTVSLIGYLVQINQNSTEYGQLQRFSLGLGYTAGGGNVSTNTVPFLAYSSYSSANPNDTNAFTLTTNAPVTNSTINGYGTYTGQGAFSQMINTTTNYQTIAPDIFRMETCFLIKSWTNASGVPQSPVYSTAPYNLNPVFTSLSGRSTNGVNSFKSLYNPSGDGSNWNYGNWGEIGLGDVQAIVVTIAVLDPTSRKIFPGGNPTTNQIATMIAALPDPVGDVTDLQANPPMLTAQIWQNAIDNGSFVQAVQAAQIPKPAAEQVRIYQRIFPLN